MNAPARMRRAARVAAIAALPPLSLATPAAALSPVASTGSARLLGTFLLAGTVTVASDVPGERRGQHFLRAWTFRPPCSTGVCPTTNLVRARANGIDEVLLRRRAPGRFVGRGSFYAPIRCGSRTYRRGALVPFTIDLHVAAAAFVLGVDIATRVNASYVNASRTNLTPCVAALGHDAASYHGHIVAGPPA
jgi:hypothetical protein